MSEAGHERIELKVSQLLRLGVVVSAAIIAAGMALVVWRGAPGYGAASVAQFRAESAPDAREGLDRLARALSEGQAGAIVQLGILLLMLTPVVRVTATVFVFLAQGDRKMTAIALVVLAVLVMSALGVVAPH